MATSDANIERQHVSAERSAGGLHQRRFGDFEDRLAAAQPRLRRLAQLRGVPPDAVEDVVQDTFVEAWKCQDRLQSPEGFAPWLDEICRNMCRRHARNLSIYQRHVVSEGQLAHESAATHADGASSPLLNVPDPHADDPLEALSREDVVTLLDRAFGALPSHARQLLEQCYLLEQPQREVAATLGLSVGAVEARLHRARHQLRLVLSGPLRDDAQALGLSLDQEYSGGWQETRLWCTLCGRRRLMGMFLPQPDGGTNLHMRCPACERNSGLIDVDNSTVHSKGLVRLDGLTSFRPAWKRTMQVMTQRLTLALQAGAQHCPYCGARTTLQLIDKVAAERMEEVALPAGLGRHPYQYWAWWKCPMCHGASSVDAGMFAASDIVYWSDAKPQQFMAQHPHWVSEPELLVEYAGQPAIRFQMTDIAGGAHLTVLAHRQTLRVLASF